jgi:hypothetical protein
MQFEWARASVAGGCWQAIEEDWKKQQASAAVIVSVLSLTVSHHSPQPPRILTYNILPSSCTILTL